MGMEWRVLEAGELQCSMHDHITSHSCKNLRTTNLCYRNAEIAMWIQNYSNPFREWLIGPVLRKKWPRSDKKYPLQEETEDESGEEQRGFGFSPDCTAPNASRHTVWIESHEMED